MTSAEQLEFSILDALLKKFKPNEKISFASMKSVLLPVLGDGDWGMIVSLSKKGIMWMSDDTQFVSVTSAGEDIHSNFKKRKKSETADIILKWGVGIIGSAAAILSVVLGLKQLGKEDSTNQLIEDTRRLTSQKDSLQRLLEDSRKTIQIELPKPSTKYSKAKDTAIQTAQKP